MDDEPDELARLRIETRRLDHHSRMLLASTLLLLIRSIEAGNIETALEMLKEMHEHYRTMADR